ncbi:hypothetical protein [Flavobacterium sp.]|uniref:hypothetical protein n=1 Tax=Flavobacterium sp. TaxID=239 RepID=UPI0022BF69C0|nr:hypothetical protein [Flavobacterium sp.]MCZ8091416.1 hypothetical protein [Flavobacterium sp.]
MIEFLVNRIILEENVTIGMVMEDALVIHNFTLVYGLQKTNGLLLSIQQKNENCYLISRFGNYVGYLQYQTDKGFSLKLNAFENFDGALDEYLELQKKNWRNEDIIKYLKIAKEIENDSKPSKMTISNPL